MATAQVFSCNYSGSIKNKLLKGGDKLFLKIEDTKISGKAFICNEEGRNGYIDNFEYPINDVREVIKGDYQGDQALIMNTRITSLYGTKKAQTIFPAIKDIDVVIELLGELKEKTAASGQMEARQATTQSQPIGRPVVPAPPVPPQQPIATQAVPSAPVPSVNLQTKAIKQEVTQNVVVKKEAGIGENVGGALLSRSTAPVQTAPTGTVGSAVMQKAPAQAAQAAAAQQKKNDSEDFQKRMEKLYVLKDCGMLTDKEFDAKKLELVSELCGMTDFNEKVQKLVVLKECGMLSEKEFDSRKVDIIKECCSTDVEDLDEYKRNVERLPYLKLGGMIDDAEFAEKKFQVLSEVEYSDADPDEITLKKLQRWPVLREADMLSEDEFKIKIQSLVDHIDVSELDPIELLSSKLRKWPILVAARLISEGEFKKKQNDVIDSFTNAPWTNVPEFSIVVERLMALKNCEWLSELDFHAKKVELLRKVANVQDYVTKVQLYIALPQIGLITTQDYEVRKQEFVDDIFAAGDGSTEEFQSKVKKLMDLEKTGMLSTDEFTNYKLKLMSEL